MSLSKDEIEKVLKADLFKELGFDTMPLEERMRIADDMGRVVMQGIWLKIMESLSEKKQEELEKMMEGETTSETLISWLKVAIPNYERVIKEEVANYKSLLVSSVKKV